MNNSASSTSRVGGTMRKLPRTLFSSMFLGVAIAAVGTSFVARADDAEIFVGQSNTAPNILLILDTSGSMVGQVTTQEAYDQNRDYTALGTGNCAGLSGRVFYKTSGSTPPSCDSSSYFSSTNLRCAAARAALATVAGQYQGDRFIQWRRTDRRTSRAWRTLDDDYDTPIECRNDNGVDGNLSATSSYPDRTASASDNTAVWTGTENNSVWANSPDSGTSATLYSANYIVYYQQFRTERLGTRLEVMQQAARTLLNSVTNVNVGLMRYSANITSESDGGGMMLWPVSPIEENRDTLIALINGLIPYGNTPLSETLFEAHQYFAGGAVRFGNTSRACSAATSTGTTTYCSGVISNLPSIDSSRVGGTADSATYLSPAADSCQKNFIVYLTDGEPTSDSEANSAITGLDDFSTLVPTGCDASGEGRCLGALAEYMFDRDLRGEEVDGEQNVATYFIGFGSAFGGTSNAAFLKLKDAGIRGGGDAYQAGDLTDLTQAFTNIFGRIQDDSTTLTAPTVAVNAFNRTRTLSDLYVSVFQPMSGMHWHGNVKKYSIDSEGQIIDRDDDPAVDPTTGFFRDSTSDAWSETDADGPSVRAGGAANQILDPTSRDVYTFIGANPGSSTPLTAAEHAFHVDNSARITDALLGTNGTDEPLRAKLIDWVRGMDVNDEDGDGSDDDGRMIMGDPMHAQPAVVVYGGTEDTNDIDDAVVYATTNDGYLHAIDVESGDELWAFIPQELIPRLRLLYENQNSATRNYGLDGDIRVLKYDVDGDGVINPADDDRVLIFFSTGRSTTTSRYYALDVTNKDAPEFLWSIGPSALPGLGQAWSPVEITRVNIDGATQNSEDMVLIFGAGYDEAEEAGAFVESSSTGNGIYIVDALYGTLLWRAGLDDGADLQLDRMTHSVPAGITVLDLDGNGYADRMYAADTAAQVWRFDIYNGVERDALVTGGVFASLGSFDDASHAAANNRRFYNSPDASVLQLNNGPVFMNVAIGSGYRGHPLNTAAEDRFYSIRDHRPFVKLTQAEYEDWTILTDDSLEDVTTNMSPTIPHSSNGWKIRLDQPGNSWRGEKVLSAANTFQNTIFFTTYLPSPSATSTACAPALGSNRAYAVSAFDARAAIPRDRPTDPNDPDPEPPPPPGSLPSDRYEELYQGGIAPEVTFLFPEQNQVVCLSGVEVLDACSNFNSRVKTYWRESLAQ